ncbi:3-isopropylmalate dehydratase small subunit [Henriciella algicola]|uniref:3-isopropylmalate dehydratase small subunit n=1 Tax=Henriciella algicola TaxID=1608422 RepID=A0A399RN86_9PROT|nr:3-isopropylmalate dehydratase small subunit [Henriciella algicola]RIJ31873.1 3-isopropylmalate dehydratase small subunit [Henriciella algicola]
MKAFTTLTSTAAALTDKGRLMANVDTDMIIPKQFLKTTEREGLSTGLFYELKTKADGSPDPDFVLNQPAHQNAGILIAGDNFGCGSSREHAPWALLDQGITCVIAPSFADIFHNNCYKNGILPIALPIEVCGALAAQTGGANHRFTVDLVQQVITTPDGAEIYFNIEPGRKQSLLEGLDDIGQTLQAASSIDAFEARRSHETPWLPRSRA